MVPPPTIPVMNVKVNARRERGGRPYGILNVALRFYRRVRIGENFITSQIQKARVDCETMYPS